jgi:hypothetical protein
MEHAFEDACRQYERDGYAILPAFSPAQIDFIEAFAKNWVRGLIRKAARDPERIDALPLEKYHEWWQIEGIDHGSLFRAANRYIVPEGELRAALLNDRLMRFLSAVYAGKLDLWADPGLGWLGFRFIRPGAGDGYPTSCKAWGAAARVISCWVPIIGHSRRETIALVPGSHRKEYERYLPSGQKFTAGEYRLANAPADVNYVRPDLARGDLIAFHPRTLHTEDVTDSPVTRLNLEYRFNPAPASQS